MPNAGTLKTTPDEVMECWKEHFSKHLNIRFPRDFSTPDTIPEPANTTGVSLPFQ